MTWKSFSAHRLQRLAGRFPGIAHGLCCQDLHAEPFSPALALAGEGSGGLSWTRTGALIPTDDSPSRIFARLFFEGTAAQKQEQMRHLEDGRSILDDVREQANSLSKSLARDDRRRLDEYLTSIRELEKQMVSDRDWAGKLKPKVDVPPPQDIPNAADLIGRTRLLFDLTHLALLNNSFGSCSA